MARWHKKTLKLKEDHGWECRPGYTIFVADRGAVRFDFPQKWVIIPEETGTIKIHDRRPPDDECTLAMTVFYLNDQVDWGPLRLAPIVGKLAEEDSREVLERGPVHEEISPRRELAWTELRVLDENEKREAYSRILIARWSNIQPLITFDFWADDLPRMRPAWDELLRTLVLGDYIEDPTQRVRD